MARHVVAKATEILNGQQITVAVEGREICIFNIEGGYFALLDRCPHEGASLCRGFRIGLVTSPSPGTYNFSRAGEMVKCPWHGWEFDIKTGQSWCDPKRLRVRSYQVAVESGEELVKGPYVAQTFPVSVEGSYIVLDL
jgi:nitrite reductase/ring-hydroxylating ferredoxin subunit